MKMKIGLLSCTAALLCTVAHAQYEITWHTMDGGGGISTGGVYEIKGTIGQSDAGQASGGEHALVGGFWAWAFVIQSADGPRLMIRYLSSTEALIYWEDTGEPAILQRCTDLKADHWEDDPGTPVWEEGEYRLPIPLSAQIRFYRLRKNE